MQKWEYWTISLKMESLSQARLDELGQEGWELVTIADTFRVDAYKDLMYMGVAYFKRPAKQELEPQGEYNGWYKRPDESS